MVIMLAIVEVQTKGSMKLQLLMWKKTPLTRRQGMLIVRSSSNIQTVMIFQQTYEDQRTLAVEYFQQNNLNISI